MMDCGDFMELCMNENFVNWIIALIAGVTIIVSILIIVCFLKWKILKEQEFDKTIFANFGKMTFPVGVARNNNAQNNAATPANGNVQNTGMPTGQQGNLKHDRQGDSKPLTGK